MRSHHRFQKLGVRAVFWGPPFSPLQPSVRITVSAAGTPIQLHTVPRTQYADEHDQWAHICAPTLKLKAKHWEMATEHRLTTVTFPYCRPGFSVARQPMAYWYLGMIISCDVVKLVHCHSSGDLIQSHSLKFYFYPVVPTFLMLALITSHDSRSHIHLPLCCFHETSNFHGKTKTHILSKKSPLFQPFPVPWVAALFSLLCSGYRP